MLDNDETTTGNSDTEGTSGAGDTTPSTTPPTDGHSPDTPGPESDAAADRPVKKAAAKRAAKAPAKKAAAKKTTARKATKAAGPAVPPESPSAAETDEQAQPAERPRKKAAARKKAVAAPEPAPEGAAEGEGSTDDTPAAPMVLFQAPQKKTAPPRKRAAKKTAAPADTADSSADESIEAGVSADGGAGKSGSPKGGKGKKKGGGGKGKGSKGAKADAAEQDERPAEAEEPEAEIENEQGDSDDSGDGEGGARRRRRRGGRRRRRPADGSDDSEDSDDSDDSDDSGGDAGDSRDSDSESSDSSEGGTGASRRRRRRRRSGDDSGGSSDDSGNANTQSRARKPRNPEDEITSIGGSTRLEAKKQRRREGREAGRRRAPIVSEAEFLARRESVDRVMVIRQKDDLTQIGVLEDKVLVEHYVARESQTSLIGNVYLGRVQNVLPSMEAAFIDIGKGRNAVLYAGEVNWSAVGHKDGQPRKIESVLSSGQTILVQVTKDPIGHKGARLTGQVSLPGRFLVYVPEGNTSGISRKLPDTERNRLKTLLKEIVPETAGVIVRTAAEGASEDELTLDVERLTARWQDIEEKVKAGKSPQLLYGEPDLTLKVVRDLFTEDFTKLVVQGDDAWDLVDGYVSHVAPDLRDRLERYDPAGNGSENKADLFTTYRVDEQIAKGLDRKVWLPSGGSLIIDRTEAMTVVDVNTGKFTGSGGNLEETVTKNNLEAAEEIVRQLRLRDIGGIIVVDFIDMVLESNRDLVLRRLVECLGRDRTRHQVAEVTSLGLVQMTRKRIGTGLLEAFSHDCEHCKGRGVVVQEQPVEPGGGRSEDDEPRGRRSRSGGRNRGRSGSGNGGNGNGNGAGATAVPSPAALAHTRPPEKSDADDHDDHDHDRDDNGRDQHQPDATEQRDDSQDATGSTRSGQLDQPVIGTPASTPPEPVDVPSSPASEAPASEPAPPEPPRLVTSTRRRTARRAAGPPAAASAAVTESTASVGAGRASLPSAEPVDVPVEPAAAGHGPEAGVSAGDPTATDEPLATPDPRADEAQPAGQDDPTWAADAPDESVDESGDGEGEDNGNGFSLTHVPIKRKGSRKR